MHLNDLRQNENAMLEQIIVCPGVRNELIVGTQVNRYFLRFLQYKIVISIVV